MTAASGFLGEHCPSRPGPPAPAGPAPGAGRDGGPGAERWRAWGPGAGRGAAAALEIAWQGDLDNAPELGSQLGLSPEAPIDVVLLEGWRRWGAELLPRLHGVFVLAVRDGDELLLYRDPSSLRNLYFHAGPRGRLAFATQLERLLGLPGVPRRLARRSLHEYLRFLDIAAPNTLYDEILALEPGQALHWSARGVESRSWPVSVDPADPMGFAEAVDRVDAHLRRAVRAGLDGSARPATFLSGGVDSALLSALALRLRPDVTALTVGFAGASYDEAPVAQRIAAHLGLRHEVLRFERTQYEQALGRFSLGADQPTADPASLATVLAFEHCREHYDAALDGTGADESVGMMPPRHVRWAVGGASLLPRGLRGALTTRLRRLPLLSRYTPVVDFEHPADTMIRWHGFTRPEVEELCAEPVSFEHTHFYRTYARFPRTSHFERYSALVDAMPCERLNQAMLVSGLRVRFPFCDTETDRFVRQLRTDYRYLPGEPKRILRVLLARYVPPKLWDGPKHGFDFPLDEFLAADGHRLVRQHLDVDRWRRSDLLSAEAVQRWAQRYIAGDARVKFRVWALVVLGAWLDKHRGLVEHCA